MKALLMYIAMVVIGAVIASLIGVYIERQFGSTISLIAFLAMFFGNFVVSWMIVLLVMDGTLRKQS